MEENVGDVYQKCIHLSKWNFHRIVLLFISVFIYRIKIIDRSIRLHMAHVWARTRDPLQCHSAQLCRVCQAYAHACRTLYCRTFGCALGCDWSICKRAELNGSAYWTVPKKQRYTFPLSFRCNTVSEWRNVTLLVKQIIEWSLPSVLFLRGNVSCKFATFSDIIFF